MLVYSFSFCTFAHLHIFVQFQDNNLFDVDAEHIQKLKRLDAVIYPLE